MIGRMLPYTLTSPIGWFFIFITAYWFCDFWDRGYWKIMQSYAYCLSTNHVQIFRTLHNRSMCKRLFIWTKLLKSLKSYSDLCKCCVSFASRCISLMNTKTCIFTHGYRHSCKHYIWMDGWVRVLRPFNSISVISRQWKGEHKRLYAIKRRLGLGRISPPKSGALTARPFHYIWCSFDEIKSDFTLNNSNILYIYHCGVFAAGFFVCPYLSHDMTKPTKWVCAQRRLRSA